MTKTRTITKKGVKVMKCTCTSIFQDNWYGRQMRVHNPVFQGKKINGWRCCVCLDEKKSTDEEKGIRKKDKEKKEDEGNSK